MSLVSASWVCSLLLAHRGPGAVPRRRESLAAHEPSPSPAHRALLPISSRSCMKYLGPDPPNLGPPVQEPWDFLQPEKSFWRTAG